MRFINVPIVTFTNVNGVDYQVRDIRPVSIFDTAYDIAVRAEDKIDEIASRDTVFGANAEGLSYSIVDNNIVAFVENNFDISKIRKLSIPIVNE